MRRLLTILVVCAVTGGAFLWWVYEGDPDRILKPLRLWLAS